MYCNSPSKCANELLQLPTLPLGFGTRMTLGSSGVKTALDHSKPSLHKIDLIYLLEDIAIDPGVIVILIPMILVGSPRSVTSHSLLR